MGRQAQRRRALRRLSASEVTESPWPCSDPACAGCELTATEWRDIQRRIFAGEDVYVVDHTGGFYPVILEHVTSGPTGMTEMLGLVKQDAREGRKMHSHTLRTRPRS